MERWQIPSQKILFFTLLARYNSSSYGQMYATKDLKKHLVLNVIYNNFS